MVRRSLVGALVVAALAATSSRAADNDRDLVERLAAQRMSLRQVESDLSSAEAEAARMRSSERTVSQRLVDATNRVGMTEHALLELVAAESVLTVDLGTTRARRAALKKRIDARETLIERRVRVLYMEGRRQPFERALLASSLTHWLAAREYLATLNRRDLIDVRHLKADRTRLDSLAALQEAQQATLDSLIAHKRAQRDTLVAAREDEQRLLDRVKRNRSLTERAAAELEAQRKESEDRISEYLARIARASANAGAGTLVGSASSLAPVDFADEKGRLPWPVMGPVVAKFGRRKDAVTRTYTRNRGIDIGAPKGTDVRSVAAGDVVMVDWLRGYGAFVILSHGQNYYTLYAHLDLVTVRRNDHVRQGQVIGISGDSGTLSDPNVHFELLAGHEALNPLEWLSPKGSEPSS